MYKDSTAVTRGFLVAVNCLGLIGSWKIGASGLIFGTMQRTRLMNTRGSSPFLWALQTTYIYELTSDSNDDK